MLIDNENDYYHNTVSHDWLTLHSGQTNRDSGRTALASFVASAQPKASQVSSLLLCRTVRLV